MNIIRQPVRQVLRRSYSNTAQFVPPAQLREMERSGGFRKWSQPEIKAKPESPTFYTGRASYYDQVVQLETAVQHSRHALTHLQLLPLPEFARAKLPPLQPVWKRKEDMSSLFNSKLTTSRYRRVTAILNNLNDYQRIALTAGCDELGTGIASVLQMFEGGNKEAVLARGKRKPIKFDEHGRTYTVGKRKTSAARVWMIPVHPKAPEASVTTPDAFDPFSATVGQTDAENAGSMLGLESFTPLPPQPTLMSSTSILVNNLPLAQYFALPADRERIVRPLKVAGVLGAYNIFAIVRGGGTTGQSGALAHGIAKGLAAHEPAVEAILRRAKLMRRDPRMVERKKTGLAKARKRYAWVKR